MFEKYYFELAESGYKNLYLYGFLAILSLFVTIFGFFSKVFKRCFSSK